METEILEPQPDANEVKLMQMDLALDHQLPTVEDVDGAKLYELRIDQVGKAAVRLPNITLSKEAKKGASYLEVKLPLGIQMLDESCFLDDGAGRLSRTENGFKIIPDVEPDKGGTWDFSVDCKRADGSMVRLPFKLTVNPDSSMLWTVKEPEPTSWTFPEEDKARMEARHQSKLMLDDELLALGVSRRGRYHELSGTFRDDSIGMWSDPSTGRYVFIVADGAGSARYSREGSRRVIETIVSKLDANLKPELWTKDDAETKQLVGDKLIQLSLYAVKQLGEYITKANEGRADDKMALKDFNTTFLVAAIKKDRAGLSITSFSVGDGAIAVIDGDNATLMCAPDGDKFSGGTCFLTTPDVWAAYKADVNAFREKRVFFKRFDKETMQRFELYLMTDGVSDPIFECDAGLNDPSKWIGLSRDLEEKVFNGSECVNESADKMIEWIHFWSKGNYDDRSLFVVKGKTRPSVRQFVVKSLRRLLPMK